MRAFCALLLALCRAIGRHGRAGRTATVEMPRDDRSDAYTDSDPIRALPDEEQAEALERVRQIYYRGTQPLTVAKARYDLIRRGGLDAPDR